MKKAGFDIIDGDSAIVPVMLYDAKLSQNMAELLKKGIYVIGFFFRWSLKIKQELEYNCLQHSQNNT
jgi:7-keto-8-aminopelargonate synthetase-like enzyme